MGKQTLVDKLVIEVRRIAEELGIHPVNLTKSQFIRHTKDFSEWDLRKVGGLSSLVKSHIPYDQKDLEAIQDHKNKNAYVNKLEKQVGNIESFKSRLITSLSRIIRKQTIDAKPLDKETTEKYLKSLKVDKKSHDSCRSLCTIWSDQHFGMNVDQEEMAGVNEFNWVIGARRLGMLCEQIATYKIEKRSVHKELVILLLGDNIAGVIHDQEGSAIDLITYQLAGTTSYYVQALNYLKTFFPKIRVICQPGNHARVMHKVSKQRAMSAKFDSFENIVFNALSHVFAHDPKISVSTTKAPYSIVNIQDHRVFATHGDTVFETGNPGKTVAISKIEEKVNKINAEQIAQGKKPFEMFCTGHVHHPLFTHVGSGVKIVINGCLIGTDPFALSVGIQSSQAVQVLWETTRQYVQGDVRSIYVSDADDKAKYDKIIKPYNYQLGAE